MNLDIVLLFYLWFIYLGREKYKEVKNYLLKNNLKIEWQSSITIFFSYIFFTANGAFKGFFKYFKTPQSPFSRVTRTESEGFIFSLAGATSMFCPLSGSDSELHCPQQR